VIVNSENVLKIAIVGIAETLVESAGKVCVFVRSIIERTVSIKDADILIMVWFISV